MVSSYWKSGAIGVSTELLRGFGFNGSHLETKGLSSAGDVIAVPLHRHNVSLDFSRIQVTTSYAVAGNWQARLQFAYDIKDQSTGVTFLQSATDSEKTAILRNMEIHHRNESYFGFTDPLVMISHRFRGILAEGSNLVVSLGSSIPLGRTEDNPIAAGQRGQPHLHIQFGTGTFDPIADISYTHNVSKHSSLTLFGTTRVPLYKNAKTYRGPFELTMVSTFRWRFTEKITFRTNYTLYYQGHAHWAGEKDPNTGLVAHMVLGGVSYRVLEHLSMGLDVRLPMAQRSLGEGDTFEFGPTVLANVMYGLSN